MTTINDTARTMLSVLRGIAELGGGQHLTSKFTPEVKALLAHLDGKVPGLMNTWLSGEERCNGITVRHPDSYDQLSFQMVAPGCYESFHPFRLPAEVEAYHELVRLAEALGIEDGDSSEEGESDSEEEEVRRRQEQRRSEV